MEQVVEEVELVSEEKETEFETTEWGELLAHNHKIKY